ncbi:MAG: GNAT family N-acetyltransferase [Parachlamydiaceae bacterium]|nr:GNAT family N-acetyltransferase [Parachlamydiaceae bacterium]
MENKKNQLFWGMMLMFMAMTFSCNGHLSSTEVDQARIQGLIFREAQESDVSVLMILMEQLGYPIEASTMMENIQQYIQAPNHKAWVAEKHGQVVGCVAVAITNCFHLPKSFLRVNTMIVDKEQRRSGIGKGLMSLAENYARDQGARIWN